jgi:Glycosyl transferase family 2
MTGRPLVSVVIPCFNLGAYLDEAVQSVLAQTVTDLEILVVDDGSTDPDTTLLLSAASWPRTRVFRTDNRGLARARNFLIGHAQGEFLCALDADDKLHPTYLENTLNAFQQDPGLTFVSSRLQMFGEENRVTPDDLRCDLPTLLVDCPVYCAALTRRAAVVAVGGYDEHMPAQGNEDWDLWISLLEAGHRGLILPEVLFFYRRRPGSMCDLCTRGQTHLDLYAYLARKHLASYRAHLPQVLLVKDPQLSHQRQLNDSLQSHVLEPLSATVARRREELERLGELLERHRRQEVSAALASSPTAPNDSLSKDRDDELAALRAEYERSLREVAALRESISWKLMAPLRRSFDLLRRQAKAKHP